MVPKRCRVLSTIWHSKGGVLGTIWHSPLGTIWHLDFFPLVGGWFAVMGW